MGGLANMTDNDGMVGASWVAKWMRRMAKDEFAQAAKCVPKKHTCARCWHTGRAELLTDLANDLDGTDNESEVDCG